MTLFSRFFGPQVEQLNPEQAKDKLKQKPAPFLLDVRQPDEFRVGHIQGASLIPLGELGQRLGELPNDREILCVCRSGSRSAAAARQLASAGYRTANLRGGMLAWQRAGLPSAKGMR
jgi:rhodanese-related sulfurtransferase